MNTTMLILAVWLFVVIGTVPTLVDKGPRRIRLAVLLFDVVGTFAVLAAAFDAMFTVLEDLQTMFGAIVGLFGLGLVALWNADLARQRDDRLHNRDQRAVANLLATEMSNIKLAAETHWKFYEDSNRIVKTSEFKTLMNDPDLMPPYGVPLLELRILPTEIVEKVFPIYLYPAKLKIVFHAFAYDAAMAVDSESELDAPNQKLVADALQSIIEKIDAAQPLLRSYADTGELPVLDSDKRDYPA